MLIFFNQSLLQIIRCHWVIFNFRIYSKRDHIIYYWVLRNKKLRSKNNACMAGLDTGFFQHSLYLQSFFKHHTACLSFSAKASHIFFGEHDLINYSLKFESNYHRLSGEVMVFEFEKYTPYIATAIPILSGFIILYWLMRQKKMKKIHTHL